LDTRYDAVLFDFDGVLADTEVLHYSCWRRLLASRAVDLTWNNYLRVLSGYSGEELLARLSVLCPSSLNLDQIRSIYVQKKKLYRDLAPSSSLIPSTVATFVHGLPVICAVVTSSERADVEHVLLNSGLLSRFSAVVCREDIDEPKPAPDGYNKVLIALGVHHALAVEDSSAGVASARAAGLEVLQVPSPDAMPAMLADKLYGH